MTHNTAAAADAENSPQNLATIQIEERIPARDGRNAREGEDAVSPTLPSGEVEPATEQPEPILLIAVVLEGVRTIPVAELAEIYEPFLATPITRRDLAVIAERITTHYRSQGYFLTRAFIPPQPIETGIIKIKVLEGVIEETAIEGMDHRNGLIRSQLRRIEREQPATLSTMERTLLLIGDIPGITVQDAVLEEIERATGRFKLTAVLDRTRATAYASLDNRGNPDAGRSEVWATTSALGIGQIIDRLQVGVFTVPEAPSELLYGEVRAARLLGTAGLEIEAMISASQNEPGPDGTETIGVESASRRASVSASLPIYRRRDSSLWGRVELDAREIEDTSDGTPLYTDNLRVLRTRLQGFTQAMGGYSWGSLEASFGTSMFGGSEESDDRSRADAGSDFTKIRAQISHTHQVWNAFSVYGYAAGQIADDALLSSEEFTVGGLPVGRGYDYSEISGDHGVAALIELRYGRDTEIALLDAYQLYGFYDFGATWNDGSFEDPKDTLASSGLGVRFMIPNGVRLELEMSKALTRPVNADGDRPWLGFVTFSASF